MHVHIGVILELNIGILNKNKDFANYNEEYDISQYFFITTSTIQSIYSQVELIKGSLWLLTLSWWGGKVNLI